MGGMADGSGPGGRTVRGGGSRERTVHEGRWTLEDRFESPWHYLPVEVGPGMAGLRVELEYERSDGTVLDLGCLGPVGFRGWSGGARSWFAITREAATPGYLPGPIEAGVWQVMIGVHRVPAQGVRYRVTAWATRLGEGLLPPATAAPPMPGSRAARRALPAGSGRRWLAGDLHAHTVHSDGMLTVPELAVLAVERGLDFLAVTDHNTVSHHAELARAAQRYGITLLPGQEVTTDGGHAGALGDIGWIDFRREPDYWLDATEARGGLLSVNHPFAGPVSWTRVMRRRPPLAEVWHWSWLDKRWTTPLAWWLAWDTAAIPVGGSDWHRPGSDAPPGCPTTWVECDGSEAGDVLDGLRAGRVAISAERDGPVLLRHDGELVAVHADGTVLAGPHGPCARVRGDLARLPGTAGPHRLLDASGATLALTP
jgi:PHP domain